MNSSVQKPVQGILEGDSMKNEFSPFILTDAIKTRCPHSSQSSHASFCKKTFYYNLKKCPKKDFLKSTAVYQVWQPSVLQD